MKGPPYLKLDVTGDSVFLPSTLAAPFISLPYRPPFPFSSLRLQSATKVFRTPHRLRTNFTELTVRVARTGGYQCVDVQNDVHLEN